MGENKEEKNRNRIVVVVAKEIPQPYAFLPVCAMAFEQATRLEKPNFWNRRSNSVATANILQCSKLLNCWVNSAFSFAFNFSPNCVSGKTASTF